MVVLICILTFLVYNPKKYKNSHSEKPLLSTVWSYDSVAITSRMQLGNGIYYSTVH